MHVRFRLTRMLASFACILLLVDTARAQQLHRWHSKDGHETEAAFHELDEKQGTITILVPKVVPINKLRSDSLQLAKLLSAGQTKEPAGKGTGRANNKGVDRDFKPNTTVNYEPFDIKKWQAKSISTKLYPWEGEQLVLLTTKNDFDPAVMKRFVERLDAGWRTYKELIGRAPNRFKNVDGKATIAAVPDAGLTCGYGCGFIGSTGVEVAGFYNVDYSMMKVNPQAFAHYYFYEMGRNFYLFEDKHSLYITGYAVFMRYVCMDALQCVDPDQKTRATIESCEQAFADSNISFLKGFTNLEDGLNEKSQRLVDKAGKPIVPSDQPVIYAAAMLKLRRDCGGDEWLKRFYQHLMKCPNVKPDTRENAIKQSLNWLVSASAAAERDLTNVFVQRWRMPLGDASVRYLAQVNWQDKKLDVATILAKLPFEMK